MSGSVGPVLSLTVQIVSAHVAHNTVAPGDLPKLINDVHRALANAGQVTTAPPRGDPAVDIKKSVRSDHIACHRLGHQSALAGVEAGREPLLRVVKRFDRQDRAGFRSSGH